MVSVVEASQIIQSVRVKLKEVTIPVGQLAGRVLSENILADRDFPPFNRVAMDGIAINAKSFSVNHQFKIENVQPAGTPQIKLQQPYACIEVMTGAMLPDGTDAVIKYEDVELSNGYATVQLKEVTEGMNIHPRGSDARLGDVLLEPGQVISPAEVALLASVGRVSVNVFDFPPTAIISSGDELVDISVLPELHQIRRSNTYALQSAMLELGWRGDIHHLHDNKEMMLKRLREVLNHYDVLILSGGVSKGKFDFIPEVLNSLGIEKLFHQVSQKPGKPFWFGKSSDKVVFALPGNPVSTFLCFYRYVKPWMLNNMKVDVKQSQAVLSSTVEFKPSLSYFLQVSTRNENGILVADPVPGGGSGDFANLKKVDGFLELPAERNVFKAGEVFDFYTFR